MKFARWTLYAGDILALAATTMIGFATHGETNVSFLPRFFAIFIPLVVAWFLLAPWLGLFQPEIIVNFKGIWRPAFVMLFAVPLAGVLRGLLLQAAVLPIFIIVLTATSTLGMTMWRGVCFLFNRKNR
jgi:hypothetical protein